MSFNIVTTEKWKNTNHYEFFITIKVYFKKEYINEYARKIISENFTIDFSKLIDLYVEEFYVLLKSQTTNDEHYRAESDFLGLISHLSPNARKIGESKIISYRVFEFEKSFKDIVVKRISKKTNLNILANKLIEISRDFLDWYLLFYNWGNVNFILMQEKIGLELLEFGIAHYNNSVNDFKITNEAIHIIKQSSLFSRNLELRERIQKNLNIITEINSLEKITIDYYQIDLDNNNRQTRIRTKLLK